MINSLINLKEIIIINGQIIETNFFNKISHMNLYIY